MSKGDVKIANKKGRIETLTQNIDELIEAGKVKSSEVPKIFAVCSLRSIRYQAEVGKLAMAELRKLEDSSSGVKFGQSRD